MLKQARAAAKSWVMISTTEKEGFVKLRDERILYISPSRTSLALTSPNTYPGTQPFSLKCDSGIAYITNLRIVYLPTTPTPKFQSFSSPLLNLQDSYVHAPFFGANYWTATLRPVAGGGIPPESPVLEVRLTFREGGAYDYHTTFEGIKERLLHAVQQARDEGRNVNERSAGGALIGVDTRALHLEQLPAYEAAREVSPEAGAGSRTLATPAGVVRLVDVEDATTTAATPVTSPTAPETTEEAFPPPDEPPPGYEETQAQAVGLELDQRLREEAARR